MMNSSIIICLRYRQSYRILTRKGITTEDEIMEEIEKIRDEVNEKVKKMGKEN